MQWTVENDGGERLDRWLAARLEGRARNQIQRDIAASRVTVDGAAAAANHRLRAGERIDYDVPEVATARPLAEDIPLRVVYEDPHLLVVDKPAGLVVHPAPGHAAGTLVNALLGRYGREIESIGGEEDGWPRCGIVHRLDSLTSGLLVVARTAQAYARLTEMMAQREIHRQYLGIAVGHFIESTGTIECAIGRRKSDRKRMGVVEESRGGRAARTDWRLLAEDQSLALLALTLHTGRTHQIRVHLQSIGRPILGDPEYGWTKARTLQGLAQNFRAVLAAVWPERQMLHAARLALAHPVIEGATVDVHSAPPEDMARVLGAVLGERWRATVNDWMNKPPPTPAGKTVGADADDSGDLPLN